MVSILTQSVETLLLAIHFICVDLAMVGPLGALLLMRRARRRDDPSAEKAACWLIQISWRAMAVAILLGVAVGLLLWLSGGGRFFAGLRRLPASRLYFSAAELAFYFALVVPCDLAWERLRVRPVLRTVLLLAAATNLIYHFPGLFVCAAELAVAPAEQSAITSADFRRLMFTPNVLAQVVHHVLSAVAVTGVAVMVYTGRLPRLENDEPQPLAVGSARSAVAATLLQIPAGLWLLATLPPATRGAVLGSDTLATSLFLSAMVAVLGLLHYLSTAAMGDADRGQTRGCVALLVVVILLMTGTLRQIREYHWAGHAQHDIGHDKLGHNHHLQRPPLVRRSNGGSRPPLAGNLVRRAYPT